MRALQINVNELLLQTIEDKYNELLALKQGGIFEKINDFEGNAIGQIGEKFVKAVLVLWILKCKNLAKLSTMSLIFVWKMAQK